MWNDCNTAAANKRVRAGEKPPISESVREKVPSGVLEIMEKCLQFNETDRPSFLELAE